MINKTTKPILFNTEDVKAILEGKKTQTSIVANLANVDCPNCEDYLVPYGWSTDMEVGYQCINEDCMYITSIKQESNYKIGVILYVEETFQTCECDICEVCNVLDGIIYKADYNSKGEHPDLYSCLEDEVYWESPVHMPKKYARIFLKVTKIRFEKSKNINNEDCIKDGFVFVYEFERIKGK